MNKHKIVQKIIFSIIIVCSISSTIKAASIPEDIKQKVLNEMGFFILIEVQLPSMVMFIKDDLWGKGFLLPYGYIERKGDEWYIAKKLTTSRLEKNKLIFSVAKRVIQSVDYANNWEEGVRKFWSFKFTYSLEPLYPELPRLEPFKGIGIASWHPATGEWIMDQSTYRSSFEDKGHREYEHFLTEQKQEYERKLQDEKRRVAEQQKAEIERLIAEKYRDNNDGTLTDALTNLMWTMEPIDGLSWSNAQKACEQLQLGEFTDWRLPTRQELETIIYKPHNTILDTSNRRYFGKIKRGGAAEHQPIWTSTKVNNKYWVWSFAKGWRDDYGPWFSATQPLCVRSIGVKAKTEQEPSSISTPGSTSIPQEKRAVASQPIIGIVITKRDPLNIRKEPGTQYEVIGKAPKGEKVVIIDSSGAWYQVQLQDGKVGYASSEYIRISSTGTNTVETISPENLDDSMALRLLREKISNEWRVDTIEENKDEHDPDCYKNMRLYDTTDINADGSPDIIIGAKKSSNAKESKIFVFWGSSFDTYVIMRDESIPFNIVKPGTIKGYDGELTLKGGGVEMVKCESSSWITYWDGKQFKKFFLSD